MTTPRHLTTARLIAAYTRGVQRAVEENRSRPARERERDRRHQLAGVGAVEAMSAGWGVFWAFANVAAAAVSFAAYSGGLAPP